MFKSLRWRLQAWHTLILSLVISGFAAILYGELRRSRFDEIDGELLSAARVLEGVMRTLPPDEFDQLPAHRLRPKPKFPPSPQGPYRNRSEPNETADPDRQYGISPLESEFPDRPPPPPQHPPRDLGPPGERLMPKQVPRPEQRPFSLPISLMDRYENWNETPYFVVRDANGEVIRTDPPDIGEKVPLDPAVGTRFESHSRNRGRLREVTLLGPGRTTILVGRSIHHELNGLRRMAWRLAGIGLGVLSVGMFGGWWLSSRAVQPIGAMSDTVSRINSTNLSQRLELNGVDTELGGLGSLINTMLERLESSFTRQVRFTADASHELRTPVAVILAQVELALSRPREAPTYRESLEACGRAARRMNALVEDLLMLARADSGKLELRIEPIDLESIAQSSVSLLEPLARLRQVHIRLVTSPTPMMGDSDRLGQVLTNLLSNAIQYNHENGEVVLTVQSDQASATAIVEDTGNGIPENDLPLIFDRFHRVDAARSRAAGGSGLGLAICRSIVEAHGGTIAVSSLLDHGSRFIVTIPKQSGPNMAEL